MNRTNPTHIVTTKVAKASAATVAVIGSFPENFTDCKRPLKWPKLILHHCENYAKLAALKKQKIIFIIKNPLT
jgi:hypothetical protein